MSGQDLSFSNVNDVFEFSKWIKTGASFIRKMANLSRNKPDSILFRQGKDIDDTGILATWTGMQVFVTASGGAVITIPDNYLNIASDYLLYSENFIESDVFLSSDCDLILYLKHIKQSSEIS